MYKIKGAIDFKMSKPFTDDATKKFFMKVPKLSLNQNGECKHIANGSYENFEGYPGLNA